jgi:TrmH family RNA methyltransferase
MLSKNAIKYIHSLEMKKNRRQERAFVVEGQKSVEDLLLSGFTPRIILAKEDWHSPTLLPSSTTLTIVNDEEMRRASLLQHPQDALGIFEMPADKSFDTRLLDKELCLCLDGVQDPGNMGTIVRTADWFGIRHIICSQKTADIYNPKTIQATMGSIARVKVYYADLENFFDNLPKDTPIYGTVLDGENIYDKTLSSHGIIVMGNEGNGISEEVKKRLTDKLLIPSFKREGERGAESLNVSIATAIVCAEFRRKC